MTTKTLAWDAATYLETPEDVAEYLAAAFETGDLEDVTHALSTIARAHGMTEIARTTGLARGSLYKAIGEGACCAFREAGAPTMAKGQKRSGREAKKPKADKKPAAAPASPFSQPPAAKKPPPPSGR